MPVIVRLLDGCLTANCCLENLKMKMPCQNQKRLGRRSLSGTVQGGTQKRTVQTILFTTTPNLIGTSSNTDESTHVQTLQTRHQCAASFLTCKGFTPTDLRPRFIAQPRQWQTTLHKVLGKKIRTRLRKPLKLFAVIPGTNCRLVSICEVMPACQLAIKATQAFFKLVLMVQGLPVRCRCTRLHPAKPQFQERFPQRWHCQVWATLSRLLLPPTILWKEKNQGIFTYALKENATILQRLSPSSLSAPLVSLTAAA